MLIGRADSPTRPFDRLWTALSTGFEYFAGGKDRQLRQLKRSMWKIIPLDQHDTFPSIKTKLAQAKSDSIALVLPSGFKLFGTSVYLRLLQRLVEDKQYQLALISGDPEDLDLAVEAGFPTYSSPSELMADLQSPGRNGNVFNRRPLVNTRFGRIRWKSSLWASMVISVLLPLISAYLFLPTAAIALTLETREVSGSFRVRVDTAAKVPHIGSAVIPGRAIEAGIDAFVAGEASGVRDVPDVKAKGHVTITNRTGGELSIPHSTVFATSDEHHFITTTDIVVPDGVGSKATVPIEGVEAGSAGNVLDNSVNRVSDPALASMVGVTNEKPTTGGSDKKRYFVKDSDVESLSKQVEERAREIGFPDLENAQMADEYVYSKTITVTIQEKHLIHQDDTSPKVELRVKGKIKGLSFDSSDMNRLVAQLLADMSGPGYVGVPSSVQLQALDASTWGSSSIVFRVMASGQVRPRMNEREIRKGIKGKTREEVVDYLEAKLPLQGHPQVRIGPFWVDRVPKILGQTYIKILN